MDQKQFKYLALLTVVHTAACMVDDIIQDSGYDIYHPKAPSPIIKDLLVSRTKLYNCCEKVMPDFNNQQTDFINQASYHVEDVIKEIFEKNYADELQGSVKKDKRKV